MSGDVGLGGLTIARFERAGRPMGMTQQLQLTVAGVSCLPEHLCGQGSAFLQPAGSHRHPSGLECATQRQWVREPTGHDDRLRAERFGALRSLEKTNSNDRRASSRARSRILRAQPVQRLLQQRDELPD